MIVMDAENDLPVGEAVPVFNPIPTKRACSM